MGEIKKYIHFLKSGTKTMFKEFFSKKTNKKQRANMLTFSRLIIAPIIPILMILGTPIGAAITVFVGALTDFFDGRCARKYNSTSEYGRILDPIVDKIFTGMIGISLSVINPLFLINILSEAAISITNISYQVKYKDLKVKSSMLGRIKQWPLGATLVLGFFSLIFPELSTITNSFIILTALIQTFTIGDYITINNKKVKSLEKVKKNNIISINDINEKDNETIKNEEKNYVSSNQRESIKEQYINLKKVLNEIIEIKKDEYTETNNYQKKRNDFN